MSGWRDIRVCWLEQQFKREVNKVAKMLSEMGIVRDGKRKDRLYLDFRFSTHQWNKQGWRLTKARNLPRPDIKPWKWAVQPAPPCVPALPCV